MSLTRVLSAFLLYFMVPYDINGVETVEKQKEKNPFIRYYWYGSRQKVGLLDLDIKSKNSTEEYNLYKSKDISIYTPALGKVFKVVKQKEIEIWCGDHLTGNAKKVLVEGIGNSKKTVTIYLMSNETLKYHKSGKNKPWTEVNIYEQTLESIHSEQKRKGKEDKNFVNTNDQSSFDDTYRKKGEKELPESEHPQEIKITAEKSTDEGNNKGYKVKIHKEKDVFEYIFDENVKCTEIMCEGMDVWKVDEKNNYPTTMTFRKAENIIIVRFNDGFMLYVRRDSGWILHPYLARMLRQSNSMRKRTINQDKKC